MALQVFFQSWLIFKVFPEVRTILVTKNSLRDQLTASLSGSSGWWSFFPLAPFQATSSLGLLPLFTGITAHKDLGNDSEWSHICFSLVYFSTNSTNQLRRQRTEMSNYCWQPAPKRNLRTSHRVTLWYCFFFFFFPLVFVLFCFSVWFCFVFNCKEVESLFYKLKMMRYFPNHQRENSNKSHRYISVLLH